MKSKVKRPTVSPVPPAPQKNHISQFSEVELKAHLFDIGEQIKKFEQEYKFVLTELSRRGQKAHRVVEKTIAEQGKKPDKK